MNQDSPSLGSHDLLGRIAYEYLQARQAGRVPKEEELLALYPQFAAELQAFLADENHVRSLLSSTQVLAQSRHGDDCATGSHTLPCLAPHTIGRFNIERQLGCGGFGIVYVAEDVLLGRRVALKVPRWAGEPSGQLREQFLREARAAALLDHPNIVQVYDVGEADGTCYIASAYCPGTTLSEWLAHQSGPIAPRVAVEVIGALASAIEYSHRHGVIHCDLKPANVLLVERSEATNQKFPYQLRLTDFGLARLVDHGLQVTRTSLVLGTPLYMAPEQAEARKEQIGPTTDLFALGIMLYEMLTGRTPFEGDNAFDVMDAVRRCEPAPPRRLRADIPRDLETICIRCLQKEPERRYPSAGSLVGDLQRFLRGEPIEARPISILEKFAIWSQRPSTLVMVGLSFLLLNILVGSWVAAEGLLVFAKYLDSTGEPVLVLGEAMAATFAHFGLSPIGLYITRGNRWAIPAAWLASTMLLGTGIAFMAGRFVPFGGIYQDRTTRIIISSLLIVIFAAQWVLCSVALYAQLSKRASSFSS